MQFKDVVAQDQVKSNLVSLFRSDRLPHALLFLGQEGVGGLPMAIAFAQYIYCQNKTATDSCGTCASCIKMSKLMHPDLHLSFPTIGAKPNLSKNFLPQFREFFQQTPYATLFNWLQFIQAENKQGNISADECRDIIDRLNLTAFEGGYKIQIIWRPEFLGKEGNILLKLIEEPPLKTILLLVAEKEEAILKTILSRTQKVILPPLTAESIAHSLSERFNMDERKALQLARISENSYTQALTLFQSSGQSDWMPVLRNWFNAIFTFNALSVTNWVDEMAKSGREQQKQFLLFTQEMLAHVFRISLNPDYRPPLAPDELDFAQKLAKKQFDFSVFEKMNQAIAKTVYHIERNAHSKTQLLFLSLQLQYLIQGKALKAGVFN